MVNKRLDMNEFILISIGSEGLDEQGFEKRKKIVTDHINSDDEWGGVNVAFIKNPDTDELRVIGSKDDNPRYLADEDEGGGNDIERLDHAIIKWMYWNGTDFDRV